MTRVVHRLAVGDDGGRQGRPHQEHSASGGEHGGNVEYDENQTGCERTKQQARVFDHRRDRVGGGQFVAGPAQFGQQSGVRRPEGGGDSGVDGGQEVHQSDRGIAPDEEEQTGAGHRPPDEARRDHPLAGQPVGEYRQQRSGGDSRERADQGHQSNRNGAAAIESQDAESNDERVLGHVEGRPGDLEAPQVAVGKDRGDGPEALGQVVDQQGDPVPHGVFGRNM